MNVSQAADLAEADRLDADLGDFDCEHLGPAVLEWTAAHRIASDAIGQDFLIEVAWPISPVPPGEKAPVIYVLDGNLNFAMTAQIARSLQHGPLPKAFVVGIGYHDAFVGFTPHPRVLRMRDLTPCHDAMVDARLRATPPPMTFPPGLRLGGAPAFLDFIERAVKPYVTARYPVDPDDQTLVGMSAGGLCTLFALLTRPQAWRRYVAVSPPLYWGGRHLFELEARLAAGTPDLPASVFLGVGGQEETHDSPQRMVSYCYQLASRLRARAYPSLELAFRVFEGETHASVYPGAVARGLAEVFA